MNLAPLTNAPPAIQLHACAALAAFVLGIAQLARVKGTTGHRALGYAWVALMLVVAISSFWIHELRLWGPWSPIHLLSIFTLAVLPLGVMHARPPQRVRSQGDHARPIRRRLDHRRHLHLRARPHHVPGAVRRVMEAPRAA